MWRLHWSAAPCTFYNFRGCTRGPTFVPKAMLQWRFYTWRMNATSLRPLQLVRGDSYLCRDDYGHEWRWRYDYNSEHCYVVMYKGRILKDIDLKQQNTGFFSTHHVSNILAVKTEVPKDIEKLDMANASWSLSRCLIASKNIAGSAKLLSCYQVSQKNCHRAKSSITPFIDFDLAKIPSAQ